MDFIFDAFLFFLPAGIANMSPVFAKYVPWLNLWRTPIDLGKTYQGRRILGDNKTWRGFVFGTLTGGVTSLLINGLVIPNASAPWFTFFAGCLLGAGALTGDAVESFFKRRRDVSPGKSWFPFDQIDYIIGGLIFIYPLALLPVALMAAILILYFGLHLLTSYIGYLIGLKSAPI